MTEATGLQNEYATKHIRNHSLKGQHDSIDADKGAYIGRTHVTSSFEILGVHTAYSTPLLHASRVYAEPLVSAMGREA